MGEETRECEVWCGSLWAPEKVAFGSGAYVGGQRIWCSKECCRALRRLGDPRPSPTPDRGPGR